MSNKEQILRLLDTELSRLILSYKSEITRLTEEKEQLLHDIEVLKTTNEELVRSIENLKKSILKPINYEELMNRLLLGNDIAYEIIDDLVLSSSPQESVLLLSVFEIFLQNEQFDMLSYILDTLIQNPQPLLQHDEQLIEQARGIFHKLLSVPPDQDISPKIFISFLKHCMSLYNTAGEGIINKFLKDTHTVILNLLSYSNDAQVTIPFLQLLLQYNLRTELEDALIQIIGLEWVFFDYNVTEQEFAFFLWISYLFDQDHKLIDKSKGSLRYLKSQNSDFTLYNYLCKWSNNKEARDTERLKSLILKFLQDSSLGDRMTASIAEKIRADVKLHPSILKAPFIGIPTYNRTLYRGQGHEINGLVKQYDLEKLPVQLPLYKEKTCDTVRKYEEIKIFLSKKSDLAFITEKDLAKTERIHQLFVKAEHYPHFPPTVTVVPKQADDGQSFSRPATELAADSSTFVQQQETTLNQNSELKLLGYKITGLTRQTRWNVLKQAVPKLGLKKVVYTIAYNIKLRKRQKDGLQRFSYAIGEWEYDLERLKTVYYKRDFNWPSPSNPRLPAPGSLFTYPSNP